MSWGTRAFACLLTALMAPQARERYREQLAADLAGAAELGISRMSVAVGAFRTAAAVTYHQGVQMPQPIGPLAIALRHAKGDNRRLFVLAAVLTATLLVGVGLLFL